ncbi:MAG: hypothetical protein QOF85_2122 [Solirubrobacterales bacterium]|jgi:hypothetical protein|nr:hypothetical protein [Solirubrobacterales bacterium]
MVRWTVQGGVGASVSSCAPTLASPGTGGGRVRWRWVAGFTATVIALVVFADVTPSEANKQAAIPAYAVKLAGGSLKQKGHWGVWVFGRGVRNCWGTRVVERALSDETAYCGYSVPRHPQQLAARGTFSTDQGPESMLFFLTRRNVALLKVLIERPGGREKLLRIHARPIGGDLAHRAHMQSDFGYGVATFSGRLSCIRRIGAWTRSGVQVGVSKPAGCRH